VPTPSASAAATGAAPSGNVVRINVDSEPPGARMFWRGKEVGTTPFVLELQPGEKHAYELGLPGYTTRKVVIDGSKTDVSIGLRPDPKAPAGATLRK
jgi:serine/threonine-protein kinase